MTLPPRTILGRYEIESLLGAGGMGEVYRARDLELRRPVALKTLVEEVGADDVRRRRLEQEARAASALNHPNILTIYEIGSAAGRYYIATELVEGQTLRQRLDGSRLPVAEGVGIAVQVAAALAAAEGAGIVHRDVKPENVMLRPDGWVKVLDFGLAKPATGQHAAQRSDPQSAISAIQTRPHVLLGTPFYMSPEQVREQPLDSRADVWSLGVVLYEMITGYIPFGGLSTPDILAAILRQEPPPLAEHARAAVPALLQQIVTTALAKDREERQGSAAALCAELKALHQALERGAELEWIAPRRGQAPAAERERRTSSGHNLIEGANTALLARPAGSRPHNLPAALGPFIGRRRELEAVERLLGSADIRLLTITGPGGVGKSRLALQLATRLLEAFADGVYFVPLASLADPALVVPAIAQVFGLSETGGSLELEALAEHLRSRQLLLLLDNFEQLAPAAASLAELLRAAPRLKLLVTSQAALRVSGEQEFPLPPLELPDLARPLAPAELAQCAAVALFAERAQAVKPDFALDRQNARAVAEICSRLDGLPLAIELAAARVKLLAPQAILTRLESSPLQLLTGGARDLPARQQTMREAIAWGYRLLAPAEQQLFQRLSVFAGPFGLEAAAAVRAPGAEAELPVLDGIASLVEKSLLRHHAPEPAATPARSTAGADEPLYRMLGTIRELGRELLSAGRGDDDARRRHAAFYLERAEAAEEQLRGPAGELWLDRLERDAPNLRAAIQHALGTGDRATALWLTGALWWFWYLRGRYAEGRRWLEEALASCGPIDDIPDELRPAAARSLLGAGAIAFLQCDYARAEEQLGTALALAREVGDARSMAQALQFLGSTARERGDHPGALARHEESFEIWRRLADAAGMARSHNYMAFAAWLQGDYRRASGLAAESLAQMRDLGDAEGIAWSELNLAAASLFDGDTGAAVARSGESLRVSREAGYKEGIAWSLELLGRATLTGGDVGAARRLLGDSLALHRELGDRWRMASVLDALAAAAVAAAEWHRAAGLLGAADALREAIGTPLPPAERRRHRRFAGFARGSLGRSETAALRAEGRRTGVERLLIALADGE